MLQLVAAVGRRRSTGEYWFAPTRAHIRPILEPLSAERRPARRPHLLSDLEGRWSGSGTIAFLSCRAPRAISLAPNERSTFPRGRRRPDDRFSRSRGALRASALATTQALGAGWRLALSGRSASRAAARPRRRRCSGCRTRSVARRRSRRQAPVSALRLWLGPGRVADSVDRSRDEERWCSPFA